MTPAKAVNKDAIIISKVGWPTTSAFNQRAVAFIANLQIFLNNFICDINKLDIKYYFFETFDVS